MKITEKAPHVVEGQTSLAYRATQFRLEQETRMADADRVNVVFSLSAHSKDGSFGTRHVHEYDNLPKEAYRLLEMKGRKAFDEWVDAMIQENRPPELAASART